MAAKARRLVQHADEGEVLLVIEAVILAETLYTLESFYKLERKQAAQKLDDLLKCRGIEAAEPTRVADALKRCREQNAHFADAYLAAASVELRFPVASFDRDFDKFKDVQRIEPKA